MTKTVPKNVAPKNLTGLNFTAEKPGAKYA